jgi:4-amino-4-deoxy-L-arabinose transferase-like glycosyltransferase
VIIKARTRIANSLIVVGVAILVWFVAILIVASPNSGWRVMLVALVPAVGAAMITTGILIRR